MKVDLRRRWRLNRHGGLRARASRWRVLYCRPLQRLGWHRSVKAGDFWGDPIRLLTGEIVSRGILPFGYAEPVACRSYFVTTNAAGGVGVVSTGSVERGRSRR